ncbi:MAG: cellulase family glycosylhydrolase [Gemmataceae bacterium]
MSAGLNMGKLGKCGSARGWWRIVGAAMLILPAATRAAGPPFIRVAEGQRGFVLDRTPFAPTGFNYDHDRKGRLLEDYWADEWPLVDQHFREMRELGANVVRIHLQLGKFMTAANKPNEANLKRLAQLLVLAEKNKLYLDVTGLGCYHKADVPAWYDALSESDRWDVQANFWTAVAKVCKHSPAVFCYDLMNEPVSPGGKRKDGDWLGPAFGDKHFVQVISLDQKGRPRPEIAKAWIKHLATAIRKVDPQHLITVGLVDWSLDRKGLTSGFVPEKVAEELDFLAVHLYPETGKLDDAMETLKGFHVGKPIIVEETFPLKCSATDLLGFMDKAKPHSAGWISFYWGRPPVDSKTIGDAIQRDWLERFPGKK